MRNINKRPAYRFVGSVPYGDNNARVCAWDGFSAVSTGELFSAPNRSRYVKAIVELSGLVQGDGRFARRGIAIEGEELIVVRNRATGMRDTIGELINITLGTENEPPQTPKGRRSNSRNQAYDTILLECIVRLSTPLAGLFYSPVEDLMKITGYSRSTVERSVHRLLTDGFLEIFGDWGGNPVYRPVENPSGKIIRAENLFTDDGFTEDGFFELEFDELEEVMAG